MDLPVSTIEGIGPVYTQQLAGKGITTITDLIDHGIRRLQLKQPLKGQENDWFNQAKLFLIEGVGKDDAEVLIRNDISIDKLDNLKAETIRQRFEAAVAKHQTRTVPDLSTIRAWQLDALRISQCPLVVFRVATSDDSQTGDFQLNIDGKSLRPDASGKILLRGIPNWRLIGKLHHRDNFVDYLDLRTLERYASLNRTYSVSALSTEANLVLALPNILVSNGMRVEYVERDLAYFKEGQGFWGKNNQNKQGLLLADRYRVRANSLIFDVLTAPDIEVQHNQKYQLHNAAIIMEA
jgi:hypothetical protein